jgi:DNA invertase Pin-like site-specific DNA recombinase
MMGGVGLLSVVELSAATSLMLDLGGDISGNGLSKLFLTIAAAFAEAERDRIRERIGQVKADQKARGRLPRRQSPLWVPTRRKWRAGLA